MGEGKNRMEVSHADTGQGCLRCEGERLMVDGPTATQGGLVQARVGQSSTRATAENNQDGGGTEDEGCRDGEFSEEAAANGARGEPEGQADEEEEEASA